MNETTSIQPKPHDPAVQKALTLEKEGKFAEAIQALREHMIAHPDDLDGWMVTVSVFERQGNLPHALAASIKAASNFPDSARAHRAAGILHLKSGMPGRAIEHLRFVMESRQDIPADGLALSHALELSGQFGPMLDVLRETVSRHPGNPTALLKLTMALFERGQVVAALQGAKSLLSMQPKNHTVWYLCGALSHLNGQLEEAREYCEESVRIDDQYAEGWAGLAMALDGLGKLEEAEQAANTALKRDPFNAKALMALSSLRRQQNNLGEAFEVLERVEPKEPKSLSDAIMLKEGAQLLDRMNRVQEAWDRTNRANAFLLERGLGSEAPAFLEKAKEWLSIPPAILESWRNKAGTQRAWSPIFLIGFPRSGTTLLEKKLSSHPAIVVSDERPLLQPLVTWVEEHASKNRRGILSTLDGLDTDEILELQASYEQQVARLLKFDPKANLLVDKLPMNLIYIPLIMTVFPDSRFIVAVRDPRDCCVSGLMQNFKHNAAMAAFHSERATATLCSTLLLGLNSWRQSIEPRATYCRYEDFVRDTPRSISEILKPFGLDVAASSPRHAISTASTPSLRDSRLPVYQTARLRWSRYIGLADSLFRELESVAVQLGYKSFDEVAENAKKNG